MRNYLTLNSLKEVEGNCVHGFTYLGRTYENYFIFDKGGRIFRKMVSGKYRELTSIKRYNKHNIRCIGVTDINGFKSNYSIAAIVLAAFKPVPNHLNDKTLHTIFKDGNKENYDLNNLDWGTYDDYYNSVVKTI